MCISPEPSPGRHPRLSAIRAAAATRAGVAGPDIVGIPHETTIPRRDASAITTCDQSCGQSGARQYGSRYHHTSRTSSTTIPRACRLGTVIAPRAYHPLHHPDESDPGPDGVNCPAARAARISSKVCPASTCALTHAACSGACCAQNVCFPRLAP